MEEVSHDVLTMLRRAVAAADLTSLIDVMCESIDSLVAASCGVVLFKLQNCMPESAIWPRVVDGRDPDYLLFFRSVSPALPFDCEDSSHPADSECPVTWTRPLASPSNASGPAWSRPGRSAGIGLTDRNRGTCYLLVLHRDDHSPPFSLRDGTLLRVISVLATRMLTLRSRADERKWECLRDREMAEGAAVLSAREAQVAELLCRRVRMAAIAKQLRISPRTVESHALHIYRKLRVANRKQLIREIAGEPR